MLTYDALIGQAKIRGMPQTKMRGILREYLQVLVLKELCKTISGSKLYFTGGTYLRLTHDLKRFSEDLDFNTESVGKKEFESMVDEIRKELRRVNINFIPEFGHWGNILAVNLIFPDIEKAYDVKSEYSRKEGIVIKLETNRPKWKVKKETEVISAFGEFFPCVCTDKAALFADKIDALGKKMRGRHIYDTIFMLSNKYPISKRVLSSLGIKENPLDAISDRIGRFSKTELKKQAEGLRPFLFQENEADLIVNAREIVPSLIEKYRRYVESVK